MLNFKKIVLLSMSIWMCDVVANGPAFMYEADGISISESGVSCRKTGNAISRIDFESPGKWKAENYSERLSIEIGKSFLGHKCLYVGGATNGRDTAWHVRSPEFTVEKGAERCLVEMKVYAGKMLSPSMQGLVDESCEKWQNAVFWYDERGNATGIGPFKYFTAGENRFADVTSELRVPPGTAKGILRFGFDYPNLGKGEWIAISDISIVGSADRYVPEASFVSEMRKGGMVSWKAAVPHGSNVSFQWRGAKNPKELLFADFRGPDGSAHTFYTSSFDANMPYVQYKAVLTSDGRSSPILQSVSVGGKEDCDWVHMIDDEPPEIWRAMESPSTNGHIKLAFEFKDDSFVDWDSVKIVVDGEEATGRFVRKGDVMCELEPRDIQYSNGVHNVEITVADCRGNSTVAHKMFYIGEQSDVPRYRLREDGMAMVDGNPFFPIGIYAVCEREFNGFSFDKAFSDLKSAGFNFAHTYGKAYEKDFLSSSEKHGFALWIGWRSPESNFMKRGRHQKNVLAWYLGDDTSEHDTPQKVRDRHDNVTAIDPNRLTCQADVLSPFWQVSRYARFVTATDVFMPEIYPVLEKAGHPSDLTCVADTIYEMKQIGRDMKRFGNGKVRACWPILQWFKGWGKWHHFPSRKQLFATSFAAIVHGANGITWYTYGGFYNKRHKRWDEGITSTPERWKAMCELTDWLRELSPVLLSMPCRQPAVAEIVSGPDKDPLGQHSVTALLKRHEGKAYLIAVNAANANVVARFKIDGVESIAEVQREGRTISCPNGIIEDVFKPFDVHVYCIKERK